MTFAKALNVVEQVEVKKKKRNVSKNRKKAWRKHTDISDIETNIIQQEEEERLGYVKYSLLIYRVNCIVIC